MGRTRIHPFLLLTLSIWLGVTVCGLIAAFTYDASYPDPDGDREFYTGVIGVFVGGFLGLMAGIFGNAWMSNREPEPYKGLGLENNKSKESE